MNKATFQKNVGLVTIMTRKGKTVSEIMAKTGFNESTVRYWQRFVK